jgi:sugar lactone lactonase YvrE
MSVTAGQHRPYKAALAVVFMLLFLGCIGLLTWASNQGAAITGPTHITAGPARVYAVLNDEILELDVQGALQARHRLQTLGVGEPVVDLRLADDGTLLVATQKPAVLYMCDWSVKKCRAAESPLFKALEAQIKVLPAAGGTGTFISDTAGGRLHWLSADAVSAHGLTPARQFKWVNDIALDAERRLWVADSGNRRIAILEQDDAAAWEISGELEARTELARPGLDRPTMLALAPGGDAWVVQSDAAGTRADLLVYDAQLGAKARVELAVDAYPTDVVRLADSMLVSDMDAFRIERIDIDSHAVSPFGDQRLRAILRAAAAERARVDAAMELALAGMAVFGALMIAMAIWATPKGRRLTAGRQLPRLQARPGAELRRGALHWLVRDARTEKWLRLAQQLLWVTTVAMAGILVYAWYALNKLLDDEAVQQAPACVAGIGELLVVFGVLALGGPVLAYLGFRSLRNSLGSDGHYLHARLHRGQHLTLDPARLVYTDRFLAYEKDLFPVLTGNRKGLYAEGEVETHIAPLLSRATRLGALAMMRYQFRHREPTTIASVFYIIVVALSLCYLGVWW